MPGEKAANPHNGHAGRAEAAARPALIGRRNPGRDVTCANGFPFHNAERAWEKCMKKYAARTPAGFAFLTAILLGSWAGTAAAQAPVAGPFAQDQVDSGRKNFAESCAECHNKDLSGVSAPALAGKAFAGNWDKKTTADLYTFIRTTMPMCQAGILGNSAYAEIVAFLLWANGAQPGPQEFDGSAAVNIGTIVTGAVRPDLSK
jgi:mono/diheme cytochrome c family protein